MPEKYKNNIKNISKINNNSVIYSLIISLNNRRKNLLNCKNKYLIYNINIMIHNIKINNNKIIYVIWTNILIT